MDPRLLSWAHSVKRRTDLPPLWLFTDPHRLPDPRRAAARLPKGLAGVVLRHDEDSARQALGRDLARICRARRLQLVVAGDPRLAAALAAGVHLRRGRWPTPQRVRHRVVTSSAHGLRELRRAYAAGADVVFLSPVFATASHPESVGLGAAQWARLALRARRPVAALGGVDGASIRRLPRRLCQAIGAIRALG